MNAQKTLAPALGWFSVALGVTQVALPGPLSRAIGTDGNTMLMRGLGLRELGAGVAVLSRRKPAAGLWARVAGDVIDMTLLAMAMRSERNNRSRLGIALGSVCAIAAADVLAAFSPTTQPEPERVRKPDFTKSVSMLIDRDALFSLMSDPRTLGLAPGFEEAHSALLQSERPSLVVWRIDGARRFSGTLHMRLLEQPDDRGTALRVDAYADRSWISGGKLARKLIGEFPGDEFATGLHRLKNIAEVGYVVSADGPSGRMKAEVRQ